MQDAWAILTQTLQSYGFTGADLQNLSDFVKTELIRGTSSNQITLDLEQTPEFARRFPAIVEREKQGLPAISPAEYLSLERSYSQLERAAGLPPNFTDQTHYDTLIANDVSPTEYADRINQGYLAVAQADPTVIQAFQDYYGITPGGLAAYFLDPTKAMPLLQQQATAAQIGGASAQSGFGEVTGEQALRLAKLNVDFSTAQKGFADLYHQRQLYTNLPGQGQEPEPTQDQLLGAEFGSDQATKDLLALHASEQKGEFSQGGKAAETQQGLTGLGQLRT